MFSNTFKQSAPRTVDDVMKAFTKTLNDLRQVHEEQTQQAELHLEQSRLAAVKHLEATAEAEKALAVSKKLEELIGVEG